jgi:ATP-dependent 26S proteasome regulatory subunit
MKEPESMSMPNAPQVKKDTLDKALTDPTVPMKIRKKLLRQVCNEEDETSETVVATVLEAATLASAGQHYVSKTKELAEVIQQIQDGPLRYGTFDRMIESVVLGRRAQLILPDGGIAFASVTDPKLAQELRCGDAVWLDSQARAILSHQPDPAMRGEEGRLERCLPLGDVEVSMGEVGRIVCRATAQLHEQIERGEAEPGCTVVVCPRRLVAWRALPEEKGPNHLRFLCSEPVPDVIVERDVGAPPAFIETISTHVRRELVNPEIGRRYGLRRSSLLLATGVPGTGKTLSINALWHRLYRIMSEITGAAIEDLPQRVLRLRASEVLSKWLGSSERNLARFFDEVSKVAGETFVAPDGTVWELPCLVICEEIDALARQRGQDTLHDRIQATLLSGLDPAQPVFRNRIVVVICTTNVPSLLDVAFVRRAGGTVATFGRMDRFGFRAVIEKHLRGRPFVGSANAQRSAVADLTAWLFAPNSGDEGLVELNYVGQPNAVTKYRRDFLTAGLVDRAVQQASAEACDDEWRGSEPIGLTTERLQRAIDAQVRHIVDQLTPGNCEQYLTLPDAVRVGTVRRVARASVLPIELERAS